MFYEIGSGSAHLYTPRTEPNRKSVVEIGVVGIGAVLPDHHPLPDFVTFMSLKKTKLDFQQNTIIKG